jgi:hypothetical protein
MKYICEDSDHSKIIRDAEKAGFERAEKLLLEVLNGNRNLRFGIEEAPIYRPQKTTSLREWNPDSPWIKLIDRLDTK